jgi:hypothetical protein
MSESKAVAPKIKKELPLRVSGANHTDPDAEKSNHQPKPKGDYLHGNGELAHDKTTRKNLPSVRKGNESAQK